MARRAGAAKQGEVNHRVIHPQRLAAAVPPALSIQPGTPPEANQIMLSFDKPEGRDYFVDWSKDLLQWTFVHQIWAGDNSRETGGSSRVSAWAVTARAASV